MTWLKDANGNKCSVENFGSEQAAQKALDSLVNCTNCTNCMACSGCFECEKCVDCYGLSGRFNRTGMRGSGPPPVPIIPYIHKAVYAAASQPGALDMGEVHTCKTTHCRAGWVITLAGAAGRKLQLFYGWDLAAIMIYEASDPGFTIDHSKFYVSNEEALADMKALAEAS